MTTVSSTASAHRADLHPVQRVRQRQDVQADRDDLDERLGLAAGAGGDHAVPDHREPEQRDADLPDQDDQGHPPGQVAEHGQPDQGGPGQCLVGDRVGDLAEVGDLPTLAGDVPVIPVGDRGDGEDPPGDPPPGRVVPALANRASRKTGTRISRSTVRAFGRFTSDTGGGGRSVIVWRPRGRASSVTVVVVAVVVVAAVVEWSQWPRDRVPSPPGRCRRCRRSDTAPDAPGRRSAAGRAALPTIRTLPSTSGAWCGPRPNTSVPSPCVRIDQHQHLGADPVLGALRGQLLDQRGDPLAPVRR